MTVTVLSEGIDDLQRFIDLVPRAATRAARIAVNDVARDFGVAAARKDVESQVAFPKGYLNDPERIRVRKFATENDLEASIFARARPTSLATFASNKTVGQRGVRVRVAQAGGGATLNRAFIIRLKRGDVLTDDTFNLGLAIRLRPGETIQNKNVRVSGPDSKLGGLSLLYGPSVYQVISSVWRDLEPKIGRALETEFIRQFARLSGGGNA